MLGQACVRVAVVAGLCGITPAAATVLYASYRQAAKYDTTARGNGEAFKKLRDWTWLYLP